MNKVTVDIWGSCVSRDLFGIHDDEQGDIDFQVTISNFFQICSIYSQFFPKPEKLLSESDFDGQYIHRFIRKCVIADWNKTVCDTLNNSLSDWLIVDFMGDRSDYLYCSFDGTDNEYILTDSVGSDNVIKALSKKNCDIKIRKVSIFDVVYTNQMEKFTSFCKERYGDRIILIEPIFCQYFLNENGVIERKLESDSRMSVISRLNREFIEKTSCYVVKCPYNVVGDVLHKWEEDSLHYISEVYHYFYQCVKFIIKHHPHYDHCRLDMFYDEVCARISDILDNKVYSVNNTIKRSKKAADDGDISTANYIINQLSEDQCIIKECELGRLYWKYAVKDLSKSAEHYRKAVSLGNVSAYGELFELLWAIGTPESLSEAYELACSGAKLGIPHSFGDLGRAYRDGKGTKADLNCAVHWMRIAIESRLWWAKIELFDILWKINTDESLKESIDIYQKYPDDTGQLDIRMGKAYRDGKGVEQDLELAAEYFHRGILKGSVWGRYDYVDLLMKIGTQEAYSEATSLCQKYVDKGDGKCALFLARMYRRGLGVDKNLDTAIILLRVAVSNKIWGAEKELFDTLWDMDRPEYYKELYILAKNGSDAGNIDMLIRQGRIFREGKGVVKNLAQSRKCFESAIECGSSWARVELFDLLLTINTDESLSKLVDTIKPVAESGNTDALVRIARAYHHGYGVKADLEQAIFWIKKLNDYNKGWALNEYFDISWDLGSEIDLNFIVKEMSKPKFIKDQSVQTRLAKMHSVKVS